MGDSEDSRDTRGRKAWAEGRASSELGDLSSPRPGGLVTTEAETWAETPSSGAGVFPPELTPPPRPFPKEKSGARGGRGAEKRGKGDPSPRPGDSQPHTHAKGAASPGDRPPSTGAAAEGWGAGT